MMNTDSKSGLSGIWLIVIFFLFVSSGLLACAGAPPTRFYVLSAGADSHLQTSETLSIGVGPIKMPDYLDRLQIVTRSNANALGLADFDRWAEPLESGFTRVLSENLGKLLATENLAAYPWPSSNKVDCQVTVEVARFDGAMGENVTLEARWALFSEKGKRLLTKETSRISEPVKGDSYEALVAAQSRALAGLSREIAEAVLEASSAKKAQ